MPKYAVHLYMVVHLYCMTVHQTTTNTLLDNGPCLPAALQFHLHLDRASTTLLQPPPRHHRRNTRVDAPRTRVQTVAEVKNQLNTMISAAAAINDMSHQHSASATQSTLKRTRDSVMAVELEQQQVSTSTLSFSRTDSISRIDVPHITISRPTKQQRVDSDCTSERVALKRKRASDQQQLREQDAAPPHKKQQRGKLVAR